MSLTRRGFIKRAAAVSAASAIGMNIPEIAWAEVAAAEKG